MKSLNPRLVRTAAALCTGILAAAGVALVSSPVAASPAQPTATGDACMVVLPNAEIVRCFDTFADARRFAEEHDAIGPPKDGGTAAPQGSGSPQARPDAGTANHLTLLSVECRYANCADNLFTAPDFMYVYGLNGPCTTAINNVDYQLPDWSAYGFNQVISGFITYNNCWAKHYDLVNFGGLAVGYQGTQLIINAALDNDTSSERWS